MGRGHHLVQQDHPQLNTLACSFQAKLPRDQACWRMGVCVTMAFTRLCREETKSSLPEPVARETAIFKAPMLPGDPERQAWHIHIVFWPT